MFEFIGDKSDYISITWSNNIKTITPIHHILDKCELNTLICSDREHNLNIQIDSQGKLLYLDGWKTIVIFECYKNHIDEINQVIKILKIFKKNYNLGLFYVIINNQTHIVDNRPHTVFWNDNKYRIKITHNLLMSFNYDDEIQRIDNIGKIDSLENKYDIKHKEQLIELCDVLYKLQKVYSDHPQYNIWEIVCEYRKREYHLPRCKRVSKR